MHEGIHWFPSASTASRKRDPLDSIGIHCITHQWITAYHQDLHEGIDWIPSGCTATHTKASTGFHQDPLHHKRGIHWFPSGSTASRTWGSTGFHRGPLHHATGDPLDSIEVHCITHEDLQDYIGNDCITHKGIHWIPLGPTTSHMRGSTRFHQEPLHQAGGYPLDSIGIQCITHQRINWIPSGSSASRHW